MSKALRRQKISGSQSELHFRGGSNVLKPNHITSYIYPSLCGYPKHHLHLQSPSQSEDRSRPQGRGSWGKDGHTFLTITRAVKDAPTETQFNQWLLQETERDKEKKNPLGKAMRRVTRFAGNTVLESGKFALRKGEPLVYVIKRTTILVLGGDNKGKFERDEAVYTIRCDKWRDLRVDSEPGHDSWWIRLHDLYQGTSDRAIWSARDNLDKLDMPPPLTKWLPRRDVESSVKIYREKIQLPENIDEACTCGNTWYSVSEYACKLNCGHFLCLECVTKIIDEKTGKGNLFPHEKDPNTHFWRCPFCRAINPMKADRVDLIQRDELPWWRWRVCQRRLEVEAKDNWITRLETLVIDRWVQPFPNNLDHNQIADWVKVAVRYNDAVIFMETVPKRAWMMLPFGFSLDNPVVSKEGAMLEDCLKKELRRLSMARTTTFNTAQLIDRMKTVGAKAFKPVIVENKDARLGNPVFPPGYEEYRDFLCEWTARGCFLSPHGRSELFEFMNSMERNKTRAWWKDVRECRFDP